MNQETQNRGGWVASFIIVGAVLVLGLLAGLYYIKSRGSEQTPQPIATNEQPDDAPKGDTPPATKDDASTSPKASDKDGDSSKSTDQPVQKEDDADSDSSREKSSAKPSTKELPVTGPADLGAQLVAITALTVAGAAYVQSRRGL